MIDAGWPDVGVRWAVLGFALPALSYLFAYSIRLGQAHHFGVPDQLVTVSLQDVLVTLVPVAAMLVWFSLAFRGLVSWLRPHPGVRKLVGPVVFMGGCALVLWWATGLAGLIWLWVGFTVLMVVLSLVVLVTRLRRHGSLKAALDGYADEVTDGPEFWSLNYWADVIRSAMRLQGAGLMLLIVLIIYLAVFGMAIGRGIARTDASFLVPVSAKDHVVLITSENRAILGVLSDEAGVVEDLYLVEEVSELGTLTVEAIGPLRGNNGSLSP